jgi:tripartite-type tricarboxylate transporter receptor subunit TctC
MNPLESLLVATAVTALGLAGLAHAQTSVPFPSKTVTLVVPSNPGSDIIARLIAPKLAERWGHPVVIDNKPGASGNIGAAQVAVAPPDGHTLLMAINSFTMTPALYKNMRFDPITNFAPVAKLAEAGYAFAIHPSVQAKDMASMMALIKKSGGKLNYALPGNGTPQHLAMELFKLQYGLHVSHVPYKGIQGAITDLAYVQVQMMVATVHSLRPLVEAGRIKEIATSGVVRNPLAPNIPTFKEQGIDVMDSVDA